MKKSASVMILFLTCSYLPGQKNATKHSAVIDDSITIVDLGSIKKMNPNTKNGAFAQKLVDRKFGEFFRYPMHDETLNNIWKDSINHQLLEDLIEDDSVSDEAKFLACIVLEEKDALYGRRHSPGTVVNIYAKALVNNFTGMANSWGLLYEPMDDGPQGVKLISMRQFSAPVLIKLLDDERSDLEYQGSAEATIGNGYRYRIKDFAAYYLGRMMGKPLKYYPAYKDRDKQIEKLKEDLKSFKFD